MVHGQIHGGPTGEAFRCSGDQLLDLLHHRGWSQNELVTIAQWLAVGSRFTHNSDCGLAVKVTMNKGGL